MPNSTSLPPPAVIRVLLVEDEPKLRDSLVEGLSLEEWAVIGAGSGAEAQRYLEAGEFDLIVLDWMLPDCDGIEIVRRLRGEGKRVPVLMITARGGPTAQDAVLGAGASDYLAKPFSFHDLLARARALLRGRI